MSVRQRPEAYVSRLPAWPESRATHRRHARGVELPALDRADLRAADPIPAPELSPAPARPAPAVPLTPLGPDLRAVLHDLSTLFAVIQGFTQLAHDGVGDRPQVRQDLMAVLDAAERARSLAGTLARTPGGETGTLTRCDLGAITAETVDILRSLVPETVDVQLSVDLEDPIINGDAAEIRRALLNVATNALDALSPEGGRLHMRVRAIRDYGPTGPTDTISVVVDDNGRGMDAETARRVCDCLYTTKKDSGGTGLGMWTVKRVMAAHGGSVHVQSVPDAGTTVRLAFPRLEERRAPDDT